MPATPFHTAQYADNEANDGADVDELLDEEDEYKDTGFTISDRLDAPSAMMIRTKDLHKLIHEGEIDLSPPYQRGRLLHSVLLSDASNASQTLFGLRISR